MEREKFDPTRFIVSGFRKKLPEEIKRYNEKIDSELDFEIEDLEKEVVELKTKHPSPETNIELKEKQNLLIKLKRPGAILASGGIGFQGRLRVGKWWPDNPGFVWDYYGLDDLKLSFGVGEYEEKRFLIFRMRQNITNRGGYPYTLLLDPGEAIWRRAGNNGPAIIQKIMEDKELYDKLMEEPDNIPYMFGNITKFLKERFALVDFNVDGKPNKELRALFEQAGQQEEIIVVGKDFMKEKPTPQEIAGNLASLPEDLRKRVNFIIGGGKSHAKACNAKIVWDPRK